MFKCFYLCVCLSACLGLFVWFVTTFLCIIVSYYLCWKNVFLCTFSVKSQQHEYIFRLDSTHSGTDQVCGVASTQSHSDQLCCVWPAQSLTVLCCMASSVPHCYVVWPAQSHNNCDGFCSQLSSALFGIVANSVSHWLLSNVASLVHTDQLCCMVWPTQSYTDCVVSCCQLSPTLLCCQFSSTQSLLGFVASSAQSHTVVWCSQFSALCWPAVLHGVASSVQHWPAVLCGVASIQSHWPAVWCSVANT